MRIRNVTRGRIDISVGDRTISLSGEGMPAGSPVDFYADIASITKWDDGTAVSEVDRTAIIKELPEVARERGWTLQLD